MDKVTDKQYINFIGTTNWRPTTDMQKLEGKEHKYNNKQNH